MPTRDEIATHSAIQNSARHLRDISETFDRFVLLYEWRQLMSVGPLGDAGQEMMRQRQMQKLEARLWPSDG